MWALIGKGSLAASPSRSISFPLAKRAPTSAMLSGKHRRPRARKVATPKEFVEFWLENSVHADEQYSPRRGRKSVQRLADNLVIAAQSQGFTKAQLEAEIGNLYDYIRAMIDQKNKTEDERLAKDSGRSV